ncbi:membrane protein insertase YidC [Paenibacillus lignilyticus]|uniref:Membrane protein insertase YidC n=1 Tax=Paenibacillus lignilyticus TaxID=1172615 RepID=A0ABS5CDM6_9BACL|nr:membrane protein insertase YidC [Paenibacillus lignilyticus]MBP3964099.1 membrane protein insertase YidC [Paenibacillus lignilyticus]
MLNMYAQVSFFHQYFVSPFSWMIDHFAGWFGGSFGLAVIAITVIVRLALMPFMINQYKQQQKMRRKMTAMQPELDAIKQKYVNNTDADKQRKQTEETMAVYSKHGYNPLNIGCLPMLLQIPILSGMYYAIRSNPELAHHTFLWFQLGKPDLILPFLAAGVYLAQALIAKSAAPQMNAAKGMGWIVYLSPVMMGIFSFSAPAAMPLYWCIGGMIIILQTLISKWMYPLEETTAFSAKTAQS